jgi:Tol biopolymer transport system component
MRTVLAAATILIFSWMVLQITMASGVASTPEIIFTSSREYPDKLYLMSADGSNLHRLGNLPGEYERGEFGPGNRRIVFSYKDPGGSDRQVYSMNTDGSDVRILTSPPGSNERPRVTFDGRIVYSHLVQEGRIISSRLYIMDEDGSRKAPLSTRAPGLAKAMEPTAGEIVSDPAFGPRGLVAFAKFERPDMNDSAMWQIYTMAVNGERLRKLTSSESWDHPAWSPDGSRIAFANEGKGVLAFSGDQPHHEHDGIYIMNADGSRRVRIVPIDFGESWVSSGIGGIAGSRQSVGLISPPSFSPDGARLTYAVNPGRTHQVYVVNVDGTGLRRLTDPPSQSWYPSFSR